MTSGTGAFRGKCGRWDGLQGLTGRLPQDLEMVLTEAVGFSDVEVMRAGGQGDVDGDRLSSVAGEAADLGEGFQCGGHESAVEGDRGLVAREDEEGVDAVGRGLDDAVERQGTVFGAMGGGESEGRLGAGLGNSLSGGFAAAFRAGFGGGWVCGSVYICLQLRVTEGDAGAGLGMWRLGREKDVADDHRLVDPGVAVAGGGDVQQDAEATGAVVEGAVGVREAVGDFGAVGLGAVAEDPVIVQAAPVVAI